MIDIGLSGFITVILTAALVYAAYRVVRLVFVAIGNVFDKLEK